MEILSGSKEHSRGFWGTKPDTSLGWQKRDCLVWDAFLHYKTQMQSSTAGQGWDLSARQRDPTGGLGTLAAHILGTALNGAGR